MCVACCALIAVWYLLFVACCPGRAAYCALCVFRCLLSAFRCVLFVGWCSPYGACWVGARYSLVDSCCVMCNALFFCGCTVWFAVCCVLCVD